jgi:hypothetical protein
MMFSMQALEVQLASHQLLLQSISRRVFGWVAWGFHLFAINFPSVNDFGRPWAAQRLLIINIVLPIIGTSCIPASNRQVLTLAACIDRAMHGLVWLFLVQVVYPKAADLWAVRWLTRLAASRAGSVALWIYLPALYLTKGAILYRFFQLGGYLRTKHTIATIVVQQAFVDGLEWLQRNMTALRQLTQTFIIGICQQALIYVAITGLLRLFINRNLGLIYFSAFSCQLSWCMVGILRGRLKHIEWDNRATTLEHVSPGTPRYVYTPLPNDGRTIRLLLLHPRYPKGLVQSSLLRTTIDNAPRFEAVSYTWGSSEKPATILLDGMALKVTANAFNLLRGMSSYVSPRILWIDSICIDQSSVNEKTYQVQLMSAIYQRAFQVTVWLNHPAVTEINSPRAQYQAAIDAAHAHYLVYKLSLLHTLSLPRAAHLNLSMGTNGMWSKMRPLTRLIQNQWFERVWVVQEVVLARRVRVIYAGVEMDWDTVVTGLVQLVDKQELHQLLMVNEDLDVESLTLTGSAKMNCLAVMMRSKIKFAEQGLVSVGDALYTSGWFKATDLRDHVFGLTGLCGRDRDGWMTPDYALKLSDVFVKASLRLVEEEGVIRTIALAGIGFHTSKTPGLEDLPSWVADWSREKTILLSDPDEKVPYAAGGALRGTNRHRHSGPSLYVFGDTFDEVTHLCPVLTLSIDAEKGINALEGVQDYFSNMLGTWVMLGLSLRIGEEYPFLASPVSRFEAFWRVLIGDRTMDKRPAPRSLGDSCIRWMRVMQNIPNNILEATTAFSDGIDVHSDMVQDYLSGMEYGKLMKSISIGRRVAVTKKGYIGLFPPLTEVGDVVCVVEGAPAPFTLRPVDSQGPLRYRLVGETFLLGIMDGEALPPANLLSVLEIV